MLIVRVLVSLLEIELCLKPDSGLSQDSLEVRKNLLGCQKMLISTRDFMLSDVSVEKSSALESQMEKSDSTEHLMNNLRKMVQVLSLNDETNYRLSVLVLLEKFLVMYLKFIKFIEGPYKEAYYQILCAFLEKDDASLMPILDKFEGLSKLLTSVTPTIADIQLLVKSENFLEIHKLITKYVIMHWPGIIQSLTETAINRGLAEKILAIPQVFDAFMLILDMPIQLEKLLLLTIDLDVNITQVTKNNSWKLAKRARELIAGAPSLFHNASMRKNAFLALKNSLSAKDLSQSEHSEIESALKAIFSFEMENQLIVPKYDELDSPMSRHRANLAVSTQATVQLHLQPQATQSGSSSSSSSSMITDSIIVRPSQTQVIRATVFNGASTNAISKESIAMASSNISCGLKKLDPFVKRGFRDFLLDQHAKENRELEMAYIDQLNRRSLRTFYNAIRAKFQAAFVGYLSIASGKVQVADNVNGHVGSLFKVLGAALGPIGGVVFNVIGESIKLVSQRRTYIDATKISYLGTLEEANRIIEEFARKLTIQYEVQIRLLESISEQAEEKKSGSAFFKMKQFIMAGRDAFKEAKLLVGDDAPQEYLAEYVIAVVFGSLVKMEKMPSKGSEFAGFLGTILQNGPLVLDNENKLFNALGFFKFNVHHTSIQWHAMDIFKKPMIAVQNANGTIEHWRSPDDHDGNYFSRPGTIQEARAMRYIKDASATAATNSTTILAIDAPAQLSVPTPQVPRTK